MTSFDFQSAKHDGLSQIKAPIWYTTNSISTKTNKTYKKQNTQALNLREKHRCPLPKLRGLASLETQIAFFPPFKKDLKNCNLTKKERLWESELDYIKNSKDVATETKGSDRFAHGIVQSSFPSIPSFPPPFIKSRDSLKKPIPHKKSCPC